MQLSSSGVSRLVCMLDMKRFLFVMSEEKSSTNSMVTLNTLDESALMF